MFSVLFLHILKYPYMWFSLVTHCMVCRRNIYDSPKSHFIFDALVCSIYGKNSMHLTMAFSPQRLDMLTYKSLITTFFMWTFSCHFFFYLCDHRLYYCFTMNLLRRLSATITERFSFRSPLLCFCFECKLHFRLSFSTTNGSTNSI